MGVEGEQISEYGVAADWEGKKGITSPSFNSLGDRGRSPAVILKGYDWGSGVYQKGGCKRDGTKGSEDGKQRSRAHGNRRRRNTEFRGGGSINRDRRGRVIIHQGYR